MSGFFKTIFILSSESRMVKISNRSFKHEIRSLSHEFLSSFLKTTKLRALERRYLRQYIESPEDSAQPLQQKARATATLESRWKTVQMWSPETGMAQLLHGWVVQINKDVHPTPPQHWLGACCLFMPTLRSEMSWSTSSPGHDSPGVSSYLEIPPVGCAHLFPSYLQLYLCISGLLQWFRGKVSACQCRRCRFDPWVAQIPWRKKWQPTPVFLPGEIHGQRGLAGYSPWGYKRVRHDLTTKQQQQ